MTRLTVGITTRDRPAALARLVSSLGLLAADDPEVLVFDDASTTPAAETLREAAVGGARLRIIRDELGPGNIVGRNRLVREAVSPFVLLLDDDAVLFSAEPIRRAVALLERDPGIAAIGFAQAEPDGSPWPAAMQPGRARIPSLVPAFIGFAHLVRKDTFLAHGGYRELLVFYGEEKELCLRFMEAGLHVVYLPDALVGHLPDAGGRSASRYVRYAMRNDCLVSIINDPWPLPLVSVPVRLWRFTRMTRNMKNGDPGGLRWLTREIVRLLPAAWRERRPVSWRTMRRWRRLARTTVPYVAP